MCGPARSACASAQKCAATCANLTERTTPTDVFFNEPYYLECEGKYYDPCLSTAYAVKNQSIKVQFRPLDTFSFAQGKMLATPDHQTCVLYMRNETVPGFNGAWVTFDATGKNVEKALGAKDFKAEMAAMQGPSGFAKFVNTLR
jgi:hypothetical protein